MIEINPHFNELEKSYLFSTIAQKITQYQQRNPKQEIIKLGIGDTILPLAPSVVHAWQEAVAEMGSESEYRGYGPEQGYQFLRAAIAEHEYHRRGVSVDENEIFVSDGAKCDSANIQELFSPSARVAIPNPVYPVYYDSNVIAGRKGTIAFLDARKENGFIVQADDSKHYDLIYLCYPNNPTGVSATTADLRRWVEYAHAHRSLIIFDAAYERFITDDSIPHSIYEIDGARDVAIEMRSYSKTAGFTGVRCAFTVVPEHCRAYHNDAPVLLHPLWLRRCTTKFNGVSYPVQRAAAAVYGAVGKHEIDGAIRYYLKNAQKIRHTLDRVGAEYYGGVNSPYIWLATGEAHTSWELFDTLLTDAHVVTTPGVGFGSNGEGYIRISAFNTAKNVARACPRIANVLQTIS